MVGTEYSLGLILLLWINNFYIYRICFSDGGDGWWGCDFVGDPGSPPHHGAHPASRSSGDQPPLCGAEGRAHPRPRWFRWTLRVSLISRDIFGASIKTHPYNICILALEYHELGSSTKSHFFYIKILIIILFAHNWSNKSTCNYNVGVRLSWTFSIRVIPKNLLYRFQQ